MELKGKCLPAHRNFAETESVSCLMIYAFKFSGMHISAGGLSERHPQENIFVANKSTVHITYPLFEVSLEPSELLCPFWMEKNVQID